MAAGFEAPDWSVRVSFANLADHVYDDIGRAVRAIARGYVQAYEASKGKPEAAGKAVRAQAGGCQEAQVGHLNTDTRSVGCATGLQQGDAS